MTKRQTGRVVAVEEYVVGSVAVADALAGAATITVADPGAFEEAGGMVRIVTDTADLVLSYTDVDDDTGVMTLGDVLPDDVAEDNPVRAEPRAIERTAYVALEDSTGPPVLAAVPHALRLLVAEGVREPDLAEAVLLHEHTPGSWTVTDVLGIEPTVSLGPDPMIRPNGPPRIVAQRIPASPLNITSSTDTVAVFTEILIDTDKFNHTFDNPFSSDRGVAIIPFRAQWDVRFSARWEGAADGFRRIWAEQSLDLGNTWTDLRNEGLADDRNPLSGAPTAHGFSHWVTFDAGTWVRFVGRQTSGNPLEIQSVKAGIVYAGPVDEQEDIAA